MSALASVIAASVIILPALAFNDLGLAAYLKTPYSSSSGTYSYAYGNEVVLQDSVLIVSSIGDRGCGWGINNFTATSETCASSGAVFVYRLDYLLGHWQLEAVLKHPHNTSYYGSMVYRVFGSEIASNGFVIAVASEQDPTCGTSVMPSHNYTYNANCTLAGAVFMYRWNGTSWLDDGVLKGSRTSASSYFGSALAMDFDRVYVGSYGESSCGTGINTTSTATDVACQTSGAVYAFRYDSDPFGSGGSWVQEAHIKAPINQKFGMFGTRKSIAVGTDVLAIAMTQDKSCDPTSPLSSNATWYSSSSCQSAGAVYTYRLFGSSSVGGAVAQYELEARLKAPAAALTTMGSFGAKVAMNYYGSLAITQSDQSCATGVNNVSLMSDRSCYGEGAVFVYSYVQGAAIPWVLDGYLKPSVTYPGSATQHQFGSSLVYNGDNLVVGVSQDPVCATGVNNMTHTTPSTGCGMSGAVYVFSNITGAWNMTNVIKTPRGTSNVYFGGAVAASYDMIAVGATGDGFCETGINNITSLMDPNASPTLCASSGAVYVYGTGSQLLTPASPPPPPTNSSPPPPPPMNSSVSSPPPAPVPVPVVPPCVCGTHGKPAPRAFSKRGLTFLPPASTKWGCTLTNGLVDCACDCQL